MIKGVGAYAMTRFPMHVKRETLNRVMDGQDVVGGAAKQIRDELGRNRPVATELEGGMPARVSLDESGRLNITPLLCAVYTGVGDDQYHYIACPEPKQQIVDLLKQEYNSAGGAGEPLVVVISTQADPNRVRELVHEFNRRKGWLASPAQISEIEGALSRKLIAGITVHAFADHLVLNHANGEQAKGGYFALMDAIASSDDPESLWANLTNAGLVE